MSVIPAEVQLRDPETGTVFWTAWPPGRESVERAALRLVEDEPEEGAPGSP
jgi:hypothetical protein